MNLSSLHLDRYVPRLLAALPVAIIVLIAAFASIIIVNRALTLLAKNTHLANENVAPFRKIARVLIAVAAGILILNAFGFSLGGMWTFLSTVLAMVAIGFVAMWSVLSNMLCTFIILLSRPFAIGDEIQFAGEDVKGRVEDMNFIYTTLRCDDGAVLQIPNNQFFQKVLRRRPSAHPRDLETQLNRPAAPPVPSPPPAAESPNESPDRLSPNR